MAVFTPVKIKFCVCKSFGFWESRSDAFTDGRGGGGESR